MLRSTLLCTLFAATMIPACATEDGASEDELGGETDLDGEAGKGDTAEAFTYFTVTPDLRACSFDAQCGGFFVSRANRATTHCGFRGATAQERCYVRGIKWEGTALPGSVAKSYEDRLRAGESILLRAELSPDPADAGVWLAATEVWVPGAKDVEADGVFVLAKDNGIRCIVAPCPSVTEIRLNANRSANISDLDFEASGADEQSIENARNDLYGGPGVILAGDRYYTMSGRSKGRRATQFWTKAPVPLH